MKRIYLFALLLTFTFAANAQQIGTSISEFQKKDGSPELLQRTLKRNTRVSTDSTRWFNYGEAKSLYQSLYTGPSKYYFPLLFPDSTVRIKYSNGDYAPDYYAFANVTAFSSTFFSESKNENLDEGTMKLNKTSEYTLDSVSIGGYYRRVSAEDVVDTLVFELAYKNNTKPYTYEYMLNKWSLDTLRFFGLPYTWATNSLNLSNKKVFKLPLHQVDSASNAFSISLATNPFPTLFASKPIICAVKFIPGYKYSETFPATMDTLNGTVTARNTFQAVMYEELGAGVQAESEKGDYNMSYKVVKSIRYNTNPNGWNGNYIPTAAYEDVDGTYDHLDIYYKVKGKKNLDFVSIDDLKASSTKVSSIYPNPTQNNFSFSVNSQSVELIKVNVYNSLGALVLSQQENASIGANSFNINTNNLQRGLYFVSIETQNGKSIQKLIKE